MKKGRALLFSFLLAGMDLSWLYGWAAFSLTASMGSPFPPFQATGTFVLAAMVTRLCLGRGWRIIQVLGLQVFAFVVAALDTIHAIYLPSHPLLGKVWLLAFLHHPRTAVEWIVLLFVLLWVVLLWTAGMAMARRPRGYYAVCARFDIGLAAFFALFLAKFGLEARGGIYVAETLSAFLVLPFFLASLLAVGVARTGEGSGERRPHGRRGMGAFLSAGTAVLLAAGCLPLLFLPWLTAAAQGGHEALKKGTGPLLPLVEGVLRFLFMHGSVRPNPPEPALPEERAWHWLAAAKGAWWMGLIERVIGWGIWCSMVLFSLLVLGALLFLALRWLFSRSPAAGADRGERGRRASWLERLRRIVALWAERLMLTIRGSDRAADFYHALDRWGRRSGLPRSLSETAVEFGTRLGGHFPSLAAQIETIVSAFNREVYGEVKLSGEGLASARSAWRALQSPFHWLQRLRIRWFTGGGKELPPEDGRADAARVSRRGFTVSDG